MNNIKFYILISITIIAFIFKTASAIETTSSINPSTPSPQEKLYCPEPSTLQKDRGWWKFSDLWKSDSQSSGKKIKEFLGAQWLGVKVGKIICLYSEEEKYAFPVALITIRSVLILEPTSSSWLSTKEGHKQCISNNVLDCPFMQSQKNENVDIYEQIKFNKEIKE